MKGGTSDSTFPVREAFIQAGLLRTYVREAGSGDPVVLIHGLGGPHAWERVLPELAASRRVLVPDLPGFGKSDCPRGGFTVDQFGDYIADLLGALSIQRCVLVGISFGGEIAVACAARHPGRVAGLVLISSTGMGPRRRIATLPLFRDIFRFLLKRWILRSRWATDILSRRAYYDPGSRPPEIVGLFHNELSDVSKRDSWLDAFWNVLIPPEEFGRWLSNLRVPVLLLWGEHDRAVPLMIAREFQSRIRECRLIEVSDCAHALPLEKPEVTCAEIRNFVAALHTP